MYKIIALDIDGTIVPGFGKLSSRTKNTLQRAYEAGAHVVISTSRPYCSTMDVLQELGIAEIPVICCAGAVLQIFPSGEIISCDTYEPEQIREIAAYCESAGQHLQVYRSDGSYYFMRRNAISDIYAKYFGYFGSQSNLLAWSERDACRAMMITPDDPADEMIMAYEAMRAALGDKYAVSCSWPGFFDIQPKFSNKGRTLGILAERLGVEREEIIAFGDQTVDKSMLDFAGVGVAMANGDEELKRAADLIAPPCEEDGVAQVLERFFN